MKRNALLWIALAIMVTGCGKKSEPESPNAKWFSSPNKVVEGIMHAYATRDDALYAALLAEDFRFFFRPQGTDSSDVLGWGKEEEVVATGNLFKTPDVESLSFTLLASQAVGAAGKPGWMMVPVSGGEMLVRVHDKEPMHVTLNRQEIVVRPSALDKKQWQIVEWHDFPVPDAASPDAASPA